MSPRHRHGPKIGSPIRRAVVTSVVSTLALASVTITGAAVTLTNSAAPRPQSPLGEAPDTTATVDITPIQADHGKQ
jgi:hypothetical protein